MASVFLPEYLNGSVITCSVAGLTNGSTRESDLIDNSTNRRPFGRIYVRIKTQAGTVAAPSRYDVYAYEVELDNNGNNLLPSNVTGADAALVSPDLDDLKWLGSVPAVSNTTRQGYLSLSPLYAPYLPRKFGIVVVNSCGVTASATAGDHLLMFCPCNSKAEAA